MLHPRECSFNIEVGDGSNVGGLQKLFKVWRGSGGDGGAFFENRC